MHILAGGCTYPCRRLHLHPITPLESLMMIQHDWNYRRSTLCDDVTFAGTRLKRQMHTPAHAHPQHTHPESPMTIKQRCGFSDPE